MSENVESIEIKKGRKKSVVIIADDERKCKKCGKVRKNDSFVKKLEDGSEKQLLSCLPCRVKYIKSKSTGNGTNCPKDNTHT
jgi:hypothetical protein